MKETGRVIKNAPGVDGGTSWTDETLPLGLRKELLARELQKAAARKAKAGAQSAEPKPGLTERKPPDRGSERKGS